MKIIDIEYVKSILDYNPETGEFIRKISTGIKTKKGMIAGTKNDRGYYQIGINNKLYYSHRLAWAIYYGVQPKIIDHANCNKSDNRLSNLRECTNSQNNANIKTPKNNKSGVKGVSWSKAHKKWIARIGKNGKSQHIGCFNNIEDADNAYRKASKEYHGEFSNLS